MLFMEISFLIISCALALLAALVLKPGKYYETVFFNAGFAVTAAYAVFTIITYLTHDFMQRIGPPYLYQLYLLHYLAVSFITVMSVRGLILFWHRQRLRNI